MLSVACAKKTECKQQKHESFFFPHPELSLLRMGKQQKNTGKNSFHANSPNLPKIICVSIYNINPSPTLGSPATQAAQDLELGFKEAQRRPGAPKVDVAKV